MRKRIVGSILLLVYVNLLPYASRVYRGLDWVAQYLPPEEYLLPALLFFVAFGSLPAIPLVVAFLRRDRFPITFLASLLVATGLLVFFHHDLDLASDAQAGIGLVFIPVFICLLTTVAAGLTAMIERFVYKRREMPKEALQAASVGAPEATTEKPEDQRVLGEVQMRRSKEEREETSRYSPKHILRYEEREGKQGDIILFLIVATCGLLIWLALSAATEHAEAWDDPLFGTVALPAMMGVAAIAGAIRPDRSLLDPDRSLWWGFGTIILQPVALLLSHEGSLGPLAGLGFFIFLLLGFPCAIAAYAGSLFRKAVQKILSKRH